MSAKWQRAKAWDDRFFPAWAWPAKFLLRTFSSITLAVVLLCFVSLYAVLASVPVGLLALGLTKLIYALSLVAAVALIAGVPVWLLGRTLRSASRSVRFAACFGALVALGAAAVTIWLRWAWPSLRWDPAHGAGFRLFPDFVDAYSATTIRRLPALEMSEIEFYSWWPLRLALLLFVLNMIVATVRRIEFRFVNAGVLTVHTGIVIMSLGSMYYGALKQEGDVLLLSPARGEAGPGPAESSFFDHQASALWIRAEGLPWEQRPIPGLPRYNDYATPWSDRPLSIVPATPDLSFLPADIRLRVVGYASYAELERQWEPLAAVQDSRAGNPTVDVELVSMLPESGAADRAEKPRVVADMRLVSGDPASRTAVLGGVIAVEHIPASQKARWDTITTRVNARTEHALVLHARGEDGAEQRVVASVRAGETVRCAGYGVRVRELLPEPPFPIITPGFEGARSSVAVLEITPPEGAAFTRYVYSRVPEVDQDITGAHEDGRPIRRAPDPAIRTEYLDTSMLQVYIRTDGPIAVRTPGGELYVSERAPEGEVLTVAPKVGVRIANRWPDARRIEAPVDVPDHKRSRDLLGNHGAAAIAVEVELASGWRSAVWVPFSKYMNVDMGMTRHVALPDGRSLDLAFGRLQRRLPGFSIALVDFEMIPYPGGEAPRDYVSLVRVIDEDRGVAYEHETRLNAPLIHRVPFIEHPEAPAVANLVGRIVTAVAPNQYKLSQAGWDSQGWTESRAAWRRGETDRPRAAFTILQVGNNPGIYVIAAGGVLMSVGIPWAFYVKPWILRRRKRKIQMSLETGAPPAREAPALETAR